MDKKSEIDKTILTNIQNQIDNLRFDLNDIKDRIEKELELDINKSKDSNQKQGGAELGQAQLQLC